MAIRRLVVLLKPFDVYPSPQSHGLSRITTLQLQHLDDRRKVHKEAINYCQNVLHHKRVEWKVLERDDLRQPVRDVDLVITVGGDGTLLHASHYIDDAVPVLGVNSDPTRPEEVEKHSSEFDATRSTGYLCAATVDNFEQILDNIIEDQISPCNLSRISISVNSQGFSTYALNDILVAHPCPATLSRFSFKIKSDDQPCSPLVNSRSSGLRVSTAAGATAAMLSAGGFPMPISSQDLQYMVREPFSSGDDSSAWKLHGFVKSHQSVVREPISSEEDSRWKRHGFVKPHQSMEATWLCKEGIIYIDGSHVRCSVKNGDRVEISSKAPVLKVFMPHRVQLSSL